MEQEEADRLYANKGPCCAGCDHWRWLPLGGECTKSAPMSGAERLGVMGIEDCTLPLAAGHAFTPAGHICGDFKDTFDWSTLPVAYLARIGGRHLAKEPRP